MKFIKIPYRRRHMTGKGLGGLFAKLSTFVKPLLKTAMKAAKPLAKKTLKEMGRHGLSAASGTMNDMLTNNMSFKEAAKKNATQGLQNVKKTATHGAKQMAKATARGVMKDIKRKKQTESGSTKKKKKKNTKPRRGIFQ